jgi:ABC-type Fe3+ transport system permease subunit
MLVHKLKRSIAAIMMLALLLVPALPGGLVSAQIDEESKNAACEGLGAVGDNCNQSNADDSIESIVATVINILSWIVGVAAVIMILIGGFKYVTANGDSNSLSSAKNTILYAIIGLVIAAVSQGLVQFVLREATTPNPDEEEGYVRMVA